MAFMSLSQLMAEQSGQELKTGCWPQESKQRPGKERTHWLARQGLLNLLSYSTQDILSKDSMELSRQHTGPAHTIINQRNSARLTYLTNNWATKFSSPQKTLLHGVGKNNNEQNNNSKTLTSSMILEN